MTADEAIDKLFGIGIDSYSIMGECLEIFHDMPSREAYRVLGQAWAACDNIAAHKDDLEELIVAASRAELDAMMEPEDLERLRGMPEQFTIWRGCYERNKEGLSWSLDRETASRFPFFWRYLQEGQPLLIEAEVKRDSVVLLSSRNESEIIAANPKVIGVYNLSKQSYAVL